MQATIARISISNGGVPKLPVNEALLGELGLHGDAVRHPDIHGGPERALCLYSAERLQALAAEGHSIAPGTAGENIVVQGIDWDAVTPGSRWKLGEMAEIEITRYTTPCATIRASFKDGDSNRIHQNLQPGWSRVYARVLTGGPLRVGDAFEALPVPANA